MAKRRNVKHLKKGRVLPLLRDDKEGYYTERKNLYLTSNETRECFRKLYGKNLLSLAKLAIREKQPELLKDFATDKTIWELIKDACR